MFSLLTSLYLNSLELSKVVSYQLFLSILKNAVMITFKPQLDYLTGCPDIWSNFGGCCEGVSE